MAPQGFQAKVAFVWKVADKLRGTFKQHEYGSVMAAAAGPAPHGCRAGPHQGRRPRPREDVRHHRLGAGRPAEEGFRASLLQHPPWTFATLLNDDKNLADNLATCIRKLSPDAYRVMEAYNFDDRIARLDHRSLRQ